MSRWGFAAAASAVAAVALAVFTSWDGWFVIAIVSLALGVVVGLAGLARRNGRGRAGAGLAIVVALAVAGAIVVWWALDHTSN